MGRSSAGGEPIFYEQYDAAYLAMTPARWSAAATQAVFGNPLNPLSYTVTGRMLSASANVFSGVARRRGKPEWNLPATVRVLDERPFGRLIRFDTGAAGERPRVLLVAPMSGHYATLLRNTVEVLIGEHDVHVTDWNDARDIPLSAGRFGLNEYVGYVMDYLRMLGPDVHVIAVCQPAPAVLAAVALLAAENDPAQPRTMTLMGGPVDARRAPTAPTELAEQHSLAWFERELTMRVPAWYGGAGRAVYPGFLQIGAFMSMHPKRHAEAHWQIFQDLVRGDGESAAKRRAFYDEYLSVMDIPAEFYLETVDEIFQRATLASGQMTWHGRPVDPAAIRRTALLTIEGELDDISAPGQTLAAHDLCSGIPAERKRNVLQHGVGHYGIFSGTRWRTAVAPEIAAFVRRFAA
ncbi:MAG TPA: polyhydroxyalkanoate depolymerase [Candidatus Elarobacter sp.]|nr:polyhydroxyalkanoate depolymerase [Candidatus Elarobacter sp.]